MICPTGIAKDDSGLGSGDAATASKQFVESILDAPGIAGNAKATKRLMDIRPTLGMVIDDTGSMGPVINQVKTGVAQIVASVRGTKDEPDQYLLQTFNDPAVGATLTFNEPDPFLAAVNAVGASGGGDCPELAWNGTYRATDKALSDSTLFVFTDASAKDTALAGNTSALASKKRIKINPVLFGSCSPFDQAYFDVAQDTGGQVFILSMFETSGILNLLAPLVKTDSHALFSARTVLAASAVAYDIAIDDTVTEATFAISMPTKGVIALMRPDGTIVAGGDADALVTDLSGGRIYTMTAPATGNWKVSVSGNGSLSVAAYGLTDLFLNDVSYVRMAGRIGHEALFPIDGLPVVGRPTKLAAELLGPFGTTSFEVRDPAGSIIQALVLAQGNPDADAQAFVGDFTPPGQPFLIYARGATRGGVAFQRVLAGEVTASTVEVLAPNPVPGLSAGKATDVAFTVTNFGSAGTFRYVAVDNHGFLASPPSGDFALDSGASTTLILSMQPPVLTPPITLVNLSLNAFRTDNDRVRNSATLSLETAAANSAPVCAVAQANPGELWPPNHKFVNVDITGITDPDGDPLTLNITGITQDEPVDGKDDGHTAPDAQGVGTPTATLRAERSGDGNGRVYAISFTASDGQGGECSGTVNVGVPKRHGKPAADSGQAFDSTVVPPGFKERDGDDDREHDTDKKEKDRDD